jgi:hypothetical protein
LSRYDAASWACGGHEATGVYRGDGISLRHVQNHNAF